MATRPRESDPYDSRAEEAIAAEADAVERQRRALEVSDFKWLMGHRQGRRFMWRLLSTTGLYSNPYRLGAPEGDVAFRCGEQNIGQQMMSEIHSLVPERYNEMVGEYQAWLKSKAQQP